MALKAYEENDIRAIAAAIRTKGETEDTYKAEDMAAAIINLPPGGHDLALLEGYALKETQAQPLVINFTPLDLDLSETGTRLIPRYFAHRGSESYHPTPSYISSQTEEENVIANAENLPYYGHITLPDTLQIIGDYAFFNQTHMTLDSLPAGLTKIGANAFYYCLALTLTEIPAGVTVGGGAFKSCTGITQMDCKTSLPDQVFYFCSGLETLKYRGAGMGISSSGRNSDFQNCSKLKNVWISKDCTAIYTGSRSMYAPFLSDTVLTDIYCEAAEQPANWQTYWNNTANSVTATVHWGVSEADFDAIVAAQA